MQVMLLHCDDCPNLKKYLEKKYLPHEILSELEDLMGRQALKGILHDIREAKVFALMVDEVTDVSGTEQMCTSIRWVDKDFGIHETPLELILRVPRTDSNTLTPFIKDCLVIIFAYKSMPRATL